MSMFLGGPTNNCDPNLQELDGFTALTADPLANYRSICNLSFFTKILEKKSCISFYITIVDMIIFNHVLGCITVQKQHRFKLQMIS